MVVWLCRELFRFVLCLCEWFGCICLFINVFGVIVIGLELVLYIEFKFVGWVVSGYLVLWWNCMFLVGSE